MDPNEVTAQIVDAAYNIHKALVRRQVPVPIEFDSLKFDEGFRMDLLVEESIIVEIKSVERNHPVHPKQLRTHLVLAKLQRGLVLNFGLERMKEGIARIVNGLPEAPKSTQEAEQDISRRDAESAEKTESNGSQEILPDNITNIFG